MTIVTNEKSTSSDALLLTNKTKNNHQFLNELFLKIMPFKKPSQQHLLHKKNAPKIRGAFKIIEFKTIQLFSQQLF